MNEVTDIRTEDGVIVHEGDRVYNYYDMKAGVIAPGSLRDGYKSGVWFDVQHEDGSHAFLNGARICTIEFAKRRGFTGA